MAAARLRASLSITATDSQFTGNTANTSPGGAIVAGGGLNLNRRDFHGQHRGQRRWRRGLYDRPGQHHAQHLPRQRQRRRWRRVVHQQHADADRFARSSTTSRTKAAGCIWRRAAATSSTRCLRATSRWITRAWRCTCCRRARCKSCTPRWPRPRSPTAMPSASIPATSRSRTRIVTNHAIGLNRFGGTCVEDYNLFFGNSINKFGSITGGTHDVSGDPKFVNPASDNYHLGWAARRIDAGTDVGRLYGY